MSPVAERMTIILMRTVIIERIHHSGDNLEIVLAHKHHTLPNKLRIRNFKLKQKRNYFNPWHIN